MSSLASELTSPLSMDVLHSLGVILPRASGQYRARLPSDAWIDLEVGTSAIDQVEAAIRTGHSEKVPGPVTVEATVARRSLLAGVDRFRADTQRGKLERQLFRALDYLSEMRLASGEAADAVESAFEVVSLDPYIVRAAPGF